MDARFHSVMKAAWQGDLSAFEALLDEEPALVTARSSCSHPTLLQFVVLDGATGKVDRPEAFAAALIDRGAILDEPLVAAASVGSQQLTAFLLGAGAPIEACAPWTPLEEAVYWAHGELQADLRERGAAVASLRCAAGLGDVGRTESFLSREGAPRDLEAVRFPWGTPSHEPQDVLDQALVIAAKNGSVDTVGLLVDAGADVGAFPPGIHEGGSAIHLAAMYGHGGVVDQLIAAGADPAAPDPKHHADAAGWASHGGFPVLAERLRGDRPG